MPTLSFWGSTTNTSQPQRGFTLTELLVVIAVIIILAALAFSGARSAMEASHTATCSNNMRQIGVGLASHQADHGRYPSKSEGIAWDRAILPYMGYEGDTNLKGNTPFTNRKSREMESFAKMFQCGSDKYKRSPNYYKRSYAIVPWTTNWSNGSSFRGWKSLPYNRGVPVYVLENPASAAMVVEWHQGEESGIANHFGAGGHAYHDRGGPDSKGRNVHKQKQNVLFADGHTELLPFIPNQEFVERYWPGSIGSTN